MGIDAIGAYSPDIIYGQLTSPFTQKQVTINSHTPYDKVDEEESTQPEVFNRESFFGAQALYAYDDVPTGTYYDEDANIFLKDYPPEILSDGVSGFSLSQISKNNLLQGAFDTSLSAKQVVAIKNANKAYERSSTLTYEVAGFLSKNSFLVS